MPSLSFVAGAPLRTISPSTRLINNTSVTSRRPAFMCAPAPAPLRVGHGFDLHRLEPGLPLILGGLELEHDRGCAGHSDGDAIYHCVVDAILGALSLPDIGQIFPDTDPRFKGCASHVFMTAAYERMVEAGYRIGNVDVTVILERPKMAPHKLAIRQNIARLLCTDLHNVNIKAKTHEKVDAVGENRAVSVHAVATLFAAAAPSEPVPAARVAAAPTPQATGAAVATSLLGTVADRVSRIQELTDGATAAQQPAPQASSHGMQRLYEMVQSRRGADPSSSWTAKLFSKGRAKIAQKVGEEAVEVVIDATSDNKSGVIKESADLLYHLSVLWADMDIEPEDVWAELAAREGTSGVAEKAARSA